MLRRNIGENKKDYCSRLEKGWETILLRFNKVYGRGGGDWVLKNSPRLMRRGEFFRFLPVIPSVADGVYEGGFALLDLGDGAFDRGAEVVGVLERAFGVPAHGFRQTGEIRIGTE